MSRLDQVNAAARDQGLTSLLVTTPANTHYLCRFAAVTYSRPIVVVVTESPVLIVPELEEEHARAHSSIADIRTYSDRMFGGVGGMSPLHLALSIALEALRDLGVKGPIGFEAEGLSAEGFFTLRSRTSSAIVPTRGVVERLRMVKDAEELDLIRKASALADYGMGVEVAASWPGNTEIAIMAEGNAAMLREGLRRHFDHRIEAESRPVSGPKTILPHSLPGVRQMATGDGVIHGTGCVVNGYHAEDERTIFIERATDLQRQLFDIMLRAGAAALRAIRPGVPCREVDRAARTIIEDAGYGPRFMHRTGHGLGLDYHELPFFAPGDDTELLPGMVMSVEPAIYIEDVGGFRHSDTIVVTEDGYEVLTPYPRDVEALTVKG